MRLRTLLLIGTGLILIAACARNRPLERVAETVGNRWAKADFATGKPWLGKVTIVNNGSNSAFGFVGLQSELSLGQFRFTKDHLQFVAVDEVFNGANSSERILNEWSIEHSDYHQKVSGGRVSNVETENDQISYDKKRYFRVNWESAVISESASFPFVIDDRCWAKKASRLVEGSQDISVGAINFTIAVDYQVNASCIDAPQYYRSDFTHTIHYKYSFIQDTVSDYKPYVYTGETDPLMKKYGYFQSIVPFMNAENRLENSFLMNRWNQTKTHTIYFTENFPSQYKWIYDDPATGIIARTNQLFAANKVPMRFEIKDNDGSKKFGDLRYSFVHFVEDSDFQAPFGYGPSDAHPRTGEIIASNTIIWTSDLKFLLKRLKDNGDRQATRAAASPIYRSMESTMQQPAASWTGTSSFLTVKELANYYRYLMPEFTYGQQGSAFANHDGVHEYLAADSHLESFKDLKAFSDINQLLSKGKASVAADLAAAGSALSASRRQAASTVWRLNDSMFTGMDKTLALADSDQVIKDILYRVAIHEFGHNLNLRHNFYGSVDGGIDRASESDPKKLVTSSVMDYLRLQDEVGLAYDWEPYDKAALLYAYTNGAIDSAAERLPYLYCSDEHTATNPLCNQFDRGTTATEVLTSLIENYDESYYLRNFRYGRAYWNTSAYAPTIFKTMLSVKRFISFYRETFSQADVARELAGIPGLNPFIPQLVSDSVQNDLRQAVKLSAAFYLSVIQQSFVDRPYFESYDEFSGGLTKLGIAYDKIFASRFLLGDDAFPLNPNAGFKPVSFIPLRDDGLIGSFINSVLSSAYVTAGDMYAGYADLGRNYFALNAASNFDFGGGRVAIDLMRIACFRKASFQSTFGVNPDSFGSPPAVLTFAVFNPTYTAASDPYFVDEPTVIVIRINGDYYVAGTSKNPYAAALIASQNVGGILNSHRSFNVVTEGRIPECR